MPSIDEFRTSTKKGAHSYFEILNTKISIPSQKDKMMLTESTIPIQLQAEAVWKNGELNITLKDFGKNFYYNNSTRLYDEIRQLF